MQTNSQHSRLCAPNIGEKWSASSLQPQASQPWNFHIHIITQIFEVPRFGSIITVNQRSRRAEQRFLSCNVRVSSHLQSADEMSHPLTCIDTFHVSGSKTPVYSSQLQTPPLSDSKSSANTYPCCPNAFATFCFAVRETWGWLESLSVEMTRIV